MADRDWRSVYDFWFPEELKLLRLEDHMRIGEWWMRGGATPQLAPFAPLVSSAKAGELDHWAASPQGRLSLIIVLDQFPRGLHAGTAQAFENDAAALLLAEQGFANGDFDRLRYPWEQFFFTLPLVHAEGRGHLKRLRGLAEMYEKNMPEALRRYPTLRPIFEFSQSQTHANIEVIERFGRFPHRNAALGRQSSPEEEAYIEAGDFVHLRRPP